MSLYHLWSRLAPLYHLMFLSPMSSLGSTLIFIANTFSTKHHLLLRAYQALRTPTVLKSMGTSLYTTVKYSPRDRSYNRISHHRLQNEQNTRKIAITSTATFHYCMIPRIQIILHLQPDCLRQAQVPSTPRAHWQTTDAINANEASIDVAISSTLPPPNSLPG